MVEYADGAVVAQMGFPDMREPIQFALAYPRRLPLNNRRLDFAALGSLTFESPDLQRFPALGLAYSAIERGGNIPCAMNAANEVAVAAYLRDEISFYGIHDLVSECMERTPFIGEPSLDNIFATNDEAAALARTLIASGRF